MCPVCGIAGLYSPAGAPNPELVDAMRAALVHRGPDEGSTDAFGHCVLGHQRLKVIDLDTGYQPVSNEAGDVVAVFNGEVYNFMSLRDQLAGHEVRGIGDTPILPHLYEESGPHFVERLDGMFAVALWDAGRERLVLARDRLGKKPLLWARLPDSTLAFASELKALLRLPQLSREIDLDAVDAYLALQYVPGDRTALRGIHKLAPGRVLVAEGATERIERYWQPEPADPSAHEGEWLERVRATVGEAVRKRLVDVASTLPRLAAAFDEPLGDEAAFPTFLIAEQARRHVTVALAGDGGDESFAGYERYVAHRLAERIPARVARGGAAALRLVPAARREPRSSLFRATRFLDVASAPAGQRYARLMEVFPVELRRELWSDRRLAQQVRLEPARPDVAGLQLLDIETYLPGDLLLKADLASMAHSLELRSPFLDHEVVALGLALPDSLKTRGREGKVALRRAFAADLPPEVAGRGKTGFGVPLGRWFRSDLRDAAHDLLPSDPGWFRPETVRRLLDEHESGHADHGHRLWCLLMLELWVREHVKAPVLISAA